MAPNIPIVITTREHDGPEPVFDADYWVDNLRNPVRFEQAVTPRAPSWALSSRSARTRC